MLSSSVAVDESTNIKPSKAVFLGWILEVTKLLFSNVALDNSVFAASTPSIKPCFLADEHEAPWADCQMFSPLKAPFIAPIQSATKTFYTRLKNLDKKLLEVTDSMLVFILVKSE